MRMLHHFDTPLNWLDTINLINFVSTKCLLFKLFPINDQSICVASRVANTDHHWHTTTEIHGATYTNDNGERMKGAERGRSSTAKLTACILFFSFVFSHFQQFSVFHFFLVARFCVRIGEKGVERWVHINYIRFKSFSKSINDDDR